MPDKLTDSEWNLSTFLYPKTRKRRRRSCGVLRCLLKRKGNPRLSQGESKNFSFKYRAKREKISNFMMAKKLILGKAMPVYGLPCK